MDEVLQELKKINQQLERVNERLGRVEERLDRVEERLNNLEEASQVTRDIVRNAGTPENNDSSRLNQKQGQYLKWI